MEIKWLVWCHERQMWWRFAGVGYTEKEHEAGRFTFEEATDIIWDAHDGGRLYDSPNETMIPDLNSIKTRTQITEIEEE